MPGAVVVTASSGTFPGLVEALRALPVAVEECPLVSFEAPPEWGPVDSALERWGEFEAIAFTSPRAARAFLGRLSERRARRPASPGPQVWAGGAGTAAALGDLLGRVQRPSDEAVGEFGSAGALAQAMMAAGVSGPVLFPCGDRRREELPARLRDLGVEVEEVVCYRSVLAAEAEARAAAERAQVLVVASPSVAHLLARSCPPGIRPALLAVGPTTAAAARACGWPPAAVAAHPSTEALTGGVRSLLTAR
ncbi:MAG TPA: uroporphyrinogen-III synthase [Gemmatimonadales bacterium]